MSMLSSPAQLASLRPGRANRRTRLLHGGSGCSVRRRGGTLVAWLGVELPLQHHIAYL